MMHDGQIITDSWVREGLSNLNEGLKNHDDSSNMDEIMELSDVPPSPPPLRPDPPSVPPPSTSKPSRKKDEDIVIPDDEYDDIIANLDLDAFILMHWLIMSMYLFFSDMNLANAYINLHTLYCLILWMDLLRIIMTII